MAERDPAKLARILETLGSLKSRSYTEFNEKVKKGTYRSNRAVRSTNLEYVRKELPRLRRKLEKKGNSLTQKKGYEEKVKKLEALEKILEEETNVETSAKSAASKASILPLKLQQQVLLKQVRLLLLLRLLLLVVENLRLLLPLLNPPPEN